MGIDDRDQIGPGQPKFRFADFSLGDTAMGSTATLPTLAQLAAFNPIANSYALAGFTVGEIEQRCLNLQTLGLALDQM